MREKERERERERDRDRDRDREGRAPFEGDRGPRVPLRHRHRWRVSSSFQKQTERGPQPHPLASERDRVPSLLEREREKE